MINKMKTIIEIEKEISDVIKSLGEHPTENEVRKVTRDVLFLRQIKYYLESEPREDFIKSKKSKIEERIKKIPNGYKDWQIGRNMTKYTDPYKSYLNEMGLPELNSKLKTLNYLLS